MVVTAPGVTLKFCVNEMPGSLTVPVVAVPPEMNRYRLPGPEGLPHPSVVQLLSNVTQKSVPWEVCGGVAAAAGDALVTAMNPVAVRTESSTARADRIAPRRCRTGRIL